MKYVVSLSGGVSSAVAADRAFQRYGKDKVLLWFADTKWEDEDLYRFMADCAKRWDVQQTTYVDGRTPLEVAEHKKLISNSRMAPCSFELKVKPFRVFISTLMKEEPVTVLLGMDWKEQHRMDSPRKSYEALGALVDYPLMWKPYELRPYQDVVRKDWGIEPPRLYAMGAPHNNCGLRCVKQGIAEWIRKRIHFPERFAEMKQWEQDQRAKGGARANRSICAETIDGHKVPITLEEIERRYLDGYYGSVGESLFQEYKDDRINCFCAIA